MELLISLLAATPPDEWAFPWAGIAAVLAGAGSLLSGIAALKLARKQGAKHETDNSDDSGIDTGSGERVHGSDSVQPGIGPDEDSDG